MNKITLLLIFGSILSSCISQKQTPFRGRGDIEHARSNIIDDFTNTYKTPRNYLKERDGKPFDVFWIFERYSNESEYVFSISPETDGFVPLTIKDRIGAVPESYFPNRFEIKEGKLFIWKENVTTLQKDVLDALHKFNVLDSTDLKREQGRLQKGYEDTRLVTIDHKLKSVHYYVCKEEIHKFQKVLTNKALKSYTPPNLECSFGNLP